MPASTSVLVERWFRDLDEVRRGMHVPLAVVSAQQGHAQHPCDLAIHHVLVDDAIWPERRTSTVAGLSIPFSLPALVKRSAQANTQPCAAPSFEYGLWEAKAHVYIYIYPRGIISLGM